MGGIDACSWFCASCCAAFTTSAFAQAEPIQPGDTLQISVWQDPKLDRQVVVGPDGMIAFPLAGHIKAGGVTPQSLENLLRARLQKNYTEKLDVTVSLAAVNPSEQSETRPRVYITGEVLKPGPYPLKPPIDIAQAIALAGGLSPFAASRRIQIHRKVDGADIDPPVRLQGVPGRRRARRQHRSAIRRYCHCSRTRAA